MIAGRYFENQMVNSYFLIAFTTCFRFFASPDAGISVL
ncbi:hypothetical protein PEDI_45540 [Persicobacter diffluens]|uniref:Uncharacterized protein n=1 Tax=Persicobacter diffluens TaxID=981 RepID=A0AAN5AMP1_9BACT|nr:hypothetical protein PEDI_45540 [Persicobacter diffluens]